MLPNIQTGDCLVEREVGIEIGVLGVGCGTEPKNWCPR